MLRAFYDGSGKGERSDPNSPLLTLAGIVAYDNLWADFEAIWRALLRKHGMQLIHMKDLRGLHRSFEGKTAAEAERAVDDFVALLACLDPAMFQAYGCTLNLEDFRRAASESEPLSHRQPADVCVNWCAGSLNNCIVIDYDNRTPGDDRMVIVFDENEEFMKRMDRIWRAVKAKPRIAKASHGWAFQIETIIPLDSKKYCGLQAADVLAWNTNRHYSVGDREDWFNVAWRNWRAYQTYYGYDRIVDEYGSRPYRESL